jgi:hypothetical protein
LAGTGDVRKFKFIKSSPENSPVGDVVYDDCTPEVAAAFAAEANTSGGQAELVLLPPGTVAADAFGTAKSDCGGGREGGEFVGSVWESGDVLPRMAESIEYSRLAA